MTDEDDTKLPAVTETNGIDAKIVVTNPVRSEDGISYFKPRCFESCSIAKSQNKNFQHALLNRASGKGATFSGFDFRYAEMSDCYFHGATFENCNFTGTKIRRCNFRTASFRDCTFDYITIEDTPLDYRQIVKQLPGRPNVAQEILQALRRNAVTLGELKAVRELTLLEVEQEREHLRRASQRQGEYYRKKYGSLSAQLSLRARAFVLWMSSVVWGHGEKVSRLILSCLVCIAVLSFSSVAVDVFRDATLSVPDAGTKLWLYFKNNVLDLLGVSITNAPDQTVWVKASVAILRLVFGGMFVAYIFRSISRR
ncbi:pentapeptide repeat-containing protein [uncultured Ruegeria sp.]|uniref:pentapeptide repeat-containing protein n=1 Tax=uncultured Ruegeria sp. TaxID=259304 RepID=UPI0026126D5C|nr:pentapeptide repeat-containing protein [uncultured Ruegeria sp.]